MNDDARGRKVAGIDILTTGLNLAELDLHGGEGLWPEVRRYVKESRIEDLVDDCLGGRAAPRIWAVMESPGAGPSAAAAGLGVALVLADRGQAVVLLDADEQDPRITRWLGRTEQEGWIDMVRFGASLHAASDPLPSDNRRGSVVGIGSFAPTGVTPEEVADLLGRLRHQADDLVLVLPAKLRSQPWLEESKIRLLCWDLLARSAMDTETIISELARMEARPTGILGFGVEEAAAIDDRLNEGAPAVAPVPEPDPVVAADVEVGLPVEEPDDRSEEPVTDPDVGDESVDESDRDMTGDDAHDDDAHDDDAYDEDAYDDDDVPGDDIDDDDAGDDDIDDDVVPGETFDDTVEPEKKRTSGIFVFVAAAAVACLTLVVLFFWDQISGGDDQVAATMVPPVVEQVPTRPAATAVMDSTEMAVAAADDEVTGGEDRPVVAEGLDADGDTGATGELVETGREASDPTAQVGEVVAEGTTEVVEDSPATPEPEPEPEPAVPAFDRAPFREPVGEAGWTVWLFSLPDEAAARREVRELERRGLVAEYRAVEIKDKGRWYRVYTGSFETRGAANRAVEGLKTKLRTDWAVPARY